MSSSVRRSISIQLNTNNSTMTSTNLQTCIPITNVNRRTDIHFSIRASFVLV